MSGLNIRLFGTFSVQWNTTEMDGFDARKVQELFSYLLLHRKQPQLRESLADLLWADNPASQSRSYLRKSLWQLQTALAAPNGCKHEVLRVESDFVQVNTEADVWLDVAAFERTFHLVQGVAGQKLESPQIEALQMAVDLYRGQLLEGWYQDWCLYERERLERMYLAMLDKLIGSCTTRGLYEEAIGYGQRVLQLDLAHELTHQRLMQLYYAAGDRTAALRQYERCVATLDKELGVPPDEATIALYDQIRSNQAPKVQPQLLPHNAMPKPATQPLQDILDRLKRFESMLGDVHRWVRQDIQAVENILDQRSP